MSTQQRKTPGQRLWEMQARFGGLLPWPHDMQVLLNALNGVELWSAQAIEGPGSMEHGDYDKKLKETPPILREIVQAWWDSGPNLARFRQANLKLASEVDSFWQLTPVELYWGNAGNAGFVNTVLNKPRITSRGEAIRFFLLLITNPYSNKLAGPCARCGNYYLKKRDSQKVYCSRRCGNAATATARSSEVRKEEHADKLRRAQAAMQKWVTARSKLDWKHWVARKHNDITPTFLTRAVNKGELKAPRKGR